MFSLSYCLLLLICLCISVLILRQIFQNSEYNKIPGPKPLLLFGNTFDILKDSASTFYLFRKLASEYKHIYKFDLILVKLIFIYAPEDVEALLSGTTYNKKGYLYSFLKPWLDDGLLLSNGSKWHNRRKILTPAFHFNILKCFNSVLITKCNKLVQDLNDETNKAKTDILSFISDFTLNSICETAMGTSLDVEMNDFGRIYKKAIHDLGSIICKRAQNIWLHPDIVYKLFPCFTSSRKENAILNLISGFRNRVIQNRRDNPHRLGYNDMTQEENIVMDGKKKLALLDILLKAVDEGKIDKNGISEEVDTFMFAGNDTTAVALQYAFMLLANHPDIQDKIVDELDRIFGSSQREPNMQDLSEMKYLECCIKESLRLYPPAFFITRVIEEPLKLRNHTCPAGSEVSVLIFDLHRQPDQFSKPLEFIPERFMGEPTWHHFAYIPFSAGPRNCIGQKFAMMEMKLAISSVLQKYRLLPVTKPEDLVFIADLILRTKDPIYVKFEKRAQE